MEVRDKKRILSFALTLVVLLSLMPAAALAVFDSVLGGIPAEADPGSGSTKWVEVDGVLKSGSEGKAYSTSTLRLTFTGDAQLSFEYKISSEESYDKFTIEHNGSVLVNGVSGEIDWTRLTVEAAAGDTLAFTYMKDSGGNGGDDCAYLRGFSAGEPVLVTFHANNGTEETASQNFFGAGSLRANGFVKDHAVFLGWGTTADGGVVYTDCASIEPTEAMDLYAVWAEAYVVSFVDTGTSVNVRQGEAIGADKVPGPLKTGYVFEGWYCGESRLDPEAPVTADAEYTARWTPVKYTIRFDPNGGAGVMADIGVKYDSAVNLPANGFAKDGYNFVGWGTYLGSLSIKYADQENILNLCDEQGEVYGCMICLMLW